MPQSSEYIRLAADFTTDSIVDGPGLRTVIWTQGCSHNCPNCQNPQTHDFNGGGLIPIGAVIEEIDKLECQNGVTFSGGDPMFQPLACSIIAKHLKKKKYNIWAYTGFTYEQLMEMTKKEPSIMEFLKNIDVLVDGKFIEEQKDLNLLFRGSKNQRLIDIPKTLKDNKIALFDEEKYLGTNLFKKEKTYI